MPLVRHLESAAAPGVYLYCERSKENTKLHAALAKALGEIEEPKRNRSGQYGEYADLAALRKATRAPLANNGLFITQTFVLMGNEMVLNTTLGHSSGEYMSSQVPIRQAQNPQHTMAYATYMRRMAYAAILSLSSEDDDDGETAADAAVASHSESQQSLFDRALKGISTADTAEAVNKVLVKVREKESVGDMAAGSHAALLKAGDARKAELSRIASKGAAK